MEQENYKVRAEELRKQIEYHSNRYYNMDDPEITDYEYDMMMQELKKLEKEFNVVLFERDSRNLQLTAVGQMFADRARILRHRKSAELQNVPRAC